ncbi:hypothetical protein PIB30_087391 [Stylosanthes scabra]|uniref:Uncharacterized protein n=1 Tax=Stylosanthes scabra TaxID=79078 RepID=A0ABU6ZS07_9FABA|nr:hypothetical protein [Stylosanthes scabra]
MRTNVNSLNARSLRKFEDLERIVSKEKEQKEAWKARKEENRATGQKQSYSVKYRELTPRRHYPRLGVAEPQGSFALIQHPTPMRDAWMKQQGSGAAPRPQRLGVHPKRLGVTMSTSSPTKHLSTHA